MLPSKNKIISFNTDISEITLPKKFTFPFQYVPHSLAKIATKELQQYLETQTDFKHNFGFESDSQEGAIGKMFGVLVVKEPNGKIGYLAAFSGKLADSNKHQIFVPPIFDMLEQEGFFKQGESVLAVYTKKLAYLENTTEYKSLQYFLKEENVLSISQLKNEQQLLISKRKQRKKLRTEKKEVLSPTQFNELESVLVNESLKRQFIYKEFGIYWEERLAKTTSKLAPFITEIEKLKQERKAFSNKIQQQLFDQYHFLNAKGDTNSVVTIFKNTSVNVPPAGAGECAAPKLLQYAFKNNLVPICMAEFWWGTSPNAEIKKHGNFYPACRGKCEPILGHMLNQTLLDDNSLLINPAEGKNLETVYEDNYLLVINKPPEFLSVPGKNIQDSVYSRIKEQFPNATGPLLVHRLDMSTSGLLLIAKTKEVHKELQKQFIERTVKKRYIAVLDGVLTETKGEINLPLRVDLEDRPRQLVCTDYGKNAKTKWQLIETIDQRSKVYFYPITGRTHQLRVHASHASGLNMPIVGDDLYGHRANRLHLHAEFLSFMHPITNKKMKIRKEAEF